MKLELFSRIYNDKYFPNYHKLSYKYKDSFSDFLHSLTNFYVNLELNDFNGNQLVYIKNSASVQKSDNKLLMKNQGSAYGTVALENEIISTASIENIHTSRDSVRKILKGFSPKNEEEIRILGQKKAYEFISYKANKITEENIYRLYKMSINDFLPENSRLSDGKKYRDGSVYIVSDRVEHQGIDVKDIPEHMAELIRFINAEDEIDDLIKACIIHFYIAYLHPYFDGNGRMSRLMHLWFLIQSDYPSTLFVPFSSLIMQSRDEYYNAFTLTEENLKFTNKIDVTPFILYFVNNVYNKMSQNTVATNTLDNFESLISSGNLTAKEVELWRFAVSNYGLNEFSTKQLEKDFGNAAYATIRSFVIKLEKMNMLKSTRYSNRVKYRIVNV